MDDIFDIDKQSSDVALLHDLDINKYINKARWLYKKKSDTWSTSFARIQ